MSQPPWMAYAWAGLGQRESSGAATNPRIADYFRRVGQPSTTSDETAWCAAYVGAALEASGVASTRSLLARSYLNWGAAVDAPSSGAIAVLSRTDNPAQGHVGFLIGETASHVILLGGNQSNAVTVAAFDRSRVLGFRMPKSAHATTIDQQPSPSPSEFDRALSHVLEFEGGWSDDPFDPGGPTHRGITLADFARERRTSVTASNFAELKVALRRISDDEVRRIYLERYWRPSRAEELPAQLAFFHFDAAVNQGVAGAARMLQDALDVTIDGEIGPVTMAAAHSTDVGQSIRTYAEIRRRRYRALAHFWRFGRGWLRRVDAAVAAALTLPSPPETSPPSTSPSQGSKPMTDRADDIPISTIPSTPPPNCQKSAGDQTSSRDSEVSARPAKWWGESITIWGALITAVSTVAPAIFALAGIDLPADLIQKLGRDAVIAVQALGGLVGTVMTIFGRLRAFQGLERRIVRVRL